MVRALLYGVAIVVLVISAARLLGLSRPGGAARASRGRRPGIRGPCPAFRCYPTAPEVPPWTFPPPRMPTPTSWPAR
jgi:hypothetical protein